MSQPGGNKPTPVKQAFDYFLDAVRGSDEARRFPELDLLAAAVNHWKQLPEEGKQVYNQKEHDDRMRFEREMRAYNGQHSVTPPRSAPRKRKSSVKDPHQPKKPLSPFFVFTMRERKKVQESNPGVSLTDASKILGEMWRGMDAEARAPYTIKAEPKTDPDRDPNQPKKPLSAFFIFTMEERKKVQESNQGVNLIEASKILGEMWRGMDSDARAPYQAKAVADKERYDRELAVYKQNASQKPNQPGTSGDRRGEQSRSSKHKDAGHRRSDGQQYPMPSNGSSMAPKPSAASNSSTIAPHWLPPGNPTYTSMGQGAMIWNYPVTARPPIPNSSWERFQQNQGIHPGGAGPGAGPNAQPYELTDDDIKKMQVELLNGYHGR